MAFKNRDVPIIGEESQEKAIISKGNPTNYHTAVYIILFKQSF
jgi:hypothetical protein